MQRLTAQAGAVVLHCFCYAVVRLRDMDCATCATVSRAWSMTAR